MFILIFEYLNWIAKKQDKSNQNLFVSFNAEQNLDQLHQNLLKKRLLSISILRQILNKIIKMPKTRNHPKPTNKMQILCLSGLSLRNGKEKENKGEYKHLDNFIDFIQQKIMNQLNFSPITDKEEESIDALSFLQQRNRTYKKSHQHKIKLKSTEVQGATRMFLRLERAIHNRKSFGFQLLKQFILFSSEQETIQVSYKYSQYQLDGAFKILDSILGLRIQKSLVSAFSDLQIFVDKRKVYSNLKNLTILSKVGNKIDKKINQSCITQSFSMLKSFTMQQIFNQNRNNISEESKNKMSQQQRNHKLKLHSLASQMKTLKNNKKAYQQKQLSRKNKLNSYLIQTPSPLLSQKLETIMHQREQQFQTNQWRDDGEDVDLFEDHSDKEYREERIRIKSVKKNEKEFLESTRHKKSTIMRAQGRENKCFTLATPGRNKEQFGDAFQTARRKNSDNKQDDEGVQNVIVIRSSRKHKRQPDRYIRVPIISEQVKIIELIPESSRKNIQTQRLQTTNSRQNSHQSHSSKKLRNNQEIHKYYEQEYIQTRLHSSRQDERKYKMKTKQDRHQWDHNHDQCFGCKYCQVIKDMESFRIQRTQQTLKIHNFI